MQNNIFSEGTDSLCIIHQPVAADKKRLASSIDSSLESEGFGVLKKVVTQKDDSWLYLALLSESHFLFYLNEADPENHYAVSSLYTCINTKPGKKTYDFLFDELKSDTRIIHSTPVVVDPSLYDGFGSDIIESKASFASESVGVVFGVDEQDNDGLESLLVNAVKESTDGSLINCSKGVLSYAFEPQGFSALAYFVEKVSSYPILVSVHTYPEFNSMAFSFFSFNNHLDSRVAFDHVLESLPHKYSSFQKKSVNTPKDYLILSAM